MEPQLLTLAELVNRGMLAMHQSGAPKAAVRTLASIGEAWGNAHPTNHKTRAPEEPQRSEETSRILKSAERLAQNLSSLHAGPDDPVFLRRQILRDLESFLVDLTSKA